MKQLKSKSMCSGCKDDFYNGRNTIGVKECWSFKDAEIVKVIQVGYWERPPYENKPIEKRLSCYHKKDTVFVKVPDQKTRKRTFTLPYWGFITLEVKDESR